MAQKKPIPSIDRDTEMVELIGCLISEVRVLRDSVDELKTALEWALRNARVEITPVESLAPRRRAISELLEEGDAVEFEQDGKEAFGEVVDVNNAFNVATVQLIPSLETVTVKQDDLTRMKNDPLAHHRNKVAAQPKQTSDTPTPKPGLLF